MRWFHQLQLRLRTLFRRAQVEDELHREFQFHLDQQIAENLAAGMSPTAAREAALRRMGGIAQIQEQCRDQRGLHWLEITIQDIRYSMRSLRKSPGFTLVAILSLALGTGANMAIFSLIDSILLNSLPVQNPQQLVFVRTNRTKVGNFMVSRTLLNRDVEQMEHQAKLFDGMASYDDFDRANVSVKGNTELAPAEFVSGRYFEVLGVRAQIGRTLLPEDNTVTGNAAAGWPAMISDGYWRRSFGGEAAVIGQPITVNTVPFVIVGVMPRDFDGLSIEQRPDIVMPLITHHQVAAGSTSAGFPGPTEPAGQVLARIKETVAQSKGASELTVVFHQTELAQGNLSTTEREKIGRLFIEFDSAARGSSVLRRRFSQPLQALMAAVGLVMLIACANIASLLLAKASARQKEVAVRLSLGSSRQRLTRQLLTESLILSMLGCAAGLGFALIARKMTLEVGDGSSASLSMHWDLRLLIFLVAICILNALLFGFIPALRATKLDPNAVLRGAQATQYSTRLPFGRLLVSGQLAISLVLVAAAALFVATLRNLYQVDLGFDSKNLLMETMDPRLAGLDDARTQEVYKRVLDNVKQMPTVQSATLMNNRLFSGRAMLSAAKVVGYIPEKGEDQSNSWIVTYGVGPQFFETVRMPMIEGRDFNETDSQGTPDVVVINQAMAKHYFRDKDPIGQKIDLGRPGRRGSAAKTAEIIGVARDAHYFDIQDEKQEAIFTPLLQAGIGDFGSEQTLVIRTKTNPANVANDIRATVRRIDSNLPVFDVTTMKEQLAGALSTSRLMALLSSFFGALALLLSAVGLYGVLAYSVSKRTGEIGIRMALGADRTSITRLILSDTAQVLTFGIVVGLGLAWASARLIKSMLYGLTPHDLRTFALSALVLTSVAVLASLIPARRAVKLDPMIALRYE